MSSHLRLNSIKTLLLTACTTTVLTSLVVSPRTASADTIDWITSAGGDFSDTSNWSGGVLPGTTDLLRFNTGGPYTVNFDTSSSNQDLLVSRGPVTFQSDGNTRNLSLSNTATITNNIGTLLLDGSNGLFQLVTGNQLTVDNNGRFQVINGARATAGQLEVINSGNLNIFSNTSLVKSNGNTTINTGGSVLVDDGELQYFAPMTIDAATLTIDNGGLVTSQQTSGATLAIQNGGLLNIIDGAISPTDSILIDNATLSEHPNGSIGNVPNYTLTAQNNAIVDLLKALPNSHTIGSGQTYNILSDSDLTFSSLGTIGLNSTGTLLVSGTGSSLTINTLGTSIGQDTGSGMGTGTGTFSDNATGTFGGVTVANGAASTGTLTVDSGADLTMDNLTIADNGSTITGGLVTVTDVGSSITQNGTSTLTIGHASSGMGKLEVLNNGTFTTGTGQTTINTTGVVDINGGTLNLLGNLLVDGGQLNHQAGDFNFGGILTAQNNAQVNLTGNFNTGSDISVLSGADLSVSGDVTVFGSSNVAILVDGPGSSMNTADLVLDNEFNLSNANYSMVVSNAATAQLGDVTVHGGDFVLVYTETATMTVASGANTTSDGLDIKLNLAGATADVTVTDNGSTWTQSAGAALTLEGRSGFKATLQVLNGGVFTNAGNVNLLTDGRIFIDGGSTVRLGTINLAGGDIDLVSGSLSYIGDLSVGPGGLLGDTSIFLNSNRDLALTGTTTINAGRTLTIAGGSLATGSLQIDGALDFLSGTLQLTGPAGLTVGPSGALGNSIFINGGQTLLVDATTTLAPGGQLSVDGDTFSTSLLVIESGGLFSAPSGYTNTNEIQLNGDSARVGGTTLMNQGIVHGSGRIQTTLDNQAGSELRTATGQRIVVTGSGNTNAGRIENFGGEVDFTQGLTHVAGGLIATRDAILRFGGLGLVNTSDVGVSFGSLDLFGDVDNQTNGQITASGNSNIIFWDDVTDTGGNIAISAGSTAVFFGSYNGSTIGTGTVFLEGGLTPGSSPGVSSFGGDVFFGSNSTLQMELAGTLGAQYDLVDIAGAANLDGTLDVLLLDGFTPSAGDSFEIITAASVNGTFATETLPALAGGLEWFVNYSGTSVELVSTFAGDFDFDGTVDGFDFLEWQRGESPNPLSALDLADWEANYGAVAPLAATSTAVPEPTTAIMLMLGMAAVLFRRQLVAS